MIGIIVEGPYDEKVVRAAAPHVFVLVLHGNGFGFNKDKIERLVCSCDLVFVMSDPDEAGDLIARKIRKHYPSTYRIHVDPDQASRKIYKKIKYGVEYCTVEYLQELIEGSIQSRQLYEVI